MFHAAAESIDDRDTRTLSTAGGVFRGCLFFDLGHLFAEALALGFGEFGFDVGLDVAIELEHRVSHVGGVCVLLHELPGLIASVFEDRADGSSLCVVEFERSDSLTDLTKEHAALALTLWTFAALTFSSLAFTPLTFATFGTFASFGAIAAAVFAAFTMRAGAAFRGFRLNHSSRAEDQESTRSRQDSTGSAGDGVLKEG